jgi:hypothetical protein
LVRNAEKQAQEFCGKRRTKSGTENMNTNITGTAEYEVGFLKAERQLSISRTTVFPFYPKKES